MASGILNFFNRIFNPILDPILRPILNLSPELSMTLITFLITLIIVLVYKKFTDQEVLKSLREEMKQIQKEMKESKHDTAKVMELNKKSMEKAAKQFKQSMKPMLITMIPILIIFSWLHANFAYEPLTPDQEFTVTMSFKAGVQGQAVINAHERLELLSEKTQTITEKTVGWLFKRKIGESTWKLKGPEGSYMLSFDFDDKTYATDILITNGKKYKEPEKIINSEVVQKIKVNNEPMKVFGLNWFLAYFILAMVFNALLRKIFKIH